mmetsp:Transcript_46778/g.77475  ORF Transcript_46778/g.77475 Transcript_46778/m.77475 type:complete len:93 (-) Transcript_46778:44-322(-)
MLCSHAHTMKVSANNLGRSSKAVSARHMSVYKMHAVKRCNYGGRPLIAVKHTNHQWTAFNLVHLPPQKNNTPTCLVYLLQHTLQANTSHLRP